MSRQRRADTFPEMAIRRLLHRDGLRYRVHLPVPGLPRRSIDIAFPRLRIAAFVDGCYWHGCPDHGTTPMTNSAWWTAKLSANRLRDLDTDRHLRSIGWEPVRIWEHEDPASAAGQLATVVAAARLTR